MKTVPFTTGELRAALQRVVFIRLTVDLSEDFRAGDIVTAQYWGMGKVVVTRPDGKTIVPVAHMIAGEFVTEFGDGPSTIHIHVDSPSKVPSVDPARLSEFDPPLSAQEKKAWSAGFEDVEPMQQPGIIRQRADATPDWQAIDTDAENGKGMP